MIHSPLPNPTEMRRNGGGGKGRRHTTLGGGCGSNLLGGGGCSFAETVLEPPGQRLRRREGRTAGGKEGGRGGDRRNHEFPAVPKGCLEATVHSLHVSRKIKETIPDARSAVVEPTDPPQEEGPRQSSHTDGADQAQRSRYGGQCPTTTHSGYLGRIPTITVQKLSLPRSRDRQGLLHLPSNARSAPSPSSFSAWPSRTN